MGNRAVVTTKQKRIGLYLHWNGGRDSVEAFLEYCKLKGYRTPETDCYGWARLSQVIGNFFGGSLSVGIDAYERLEGAGDDNGTYIIEDWEIVGREHFVGFEQNEYNLADMLVEIDKAQPEKERLGKEFLTLPFTRTSELKVGDIVYFVNHHGESEKQEIVGIGKDEIVNGLDVKGIPFISRWGYGEPSQNVNNYLTEGAYKAIIEKN